MRTWCLIIDEASSLYEMKQNTGNCFAELKNMVGLVVCLESIYTANRIYKNLGVMR